MKLETAEELWKGFTDVPIALLAVLFGLLLRRKKGWREMFFLLAVTALLGTAVHVLVIPEPLHSVLWSVEFALLFALIALFAHRMEVYLTQKPVKEPKDVLFSGLALWVCAVILRFTYPNLDIYMLVPFAVGLMIRMILCFARQEKKPRLMKLLLPVLLAALAAQALKDVIPYGVVLVHAFIAAALFLVYRMGRESGL